MYDPISSDYAQDYAEQNGLVIRTPKTNELFIDIDTPEQLETYQKNKERILRFLEPEEANFETITPSRNGGDGKHIVLKFKKFFTDVERIAYQAVLGSDLTREALSLHRYEDDDSNPTLFYELPEETNV